VSHICFDPPFSSGISRCVRGRSRLTGVLLQAIHEVGSRLAPLPSERPMIMNWETPSFVEIDMSAEIGSYQGEDDNGL
jgi:coenzyme PQQ precursor peptide PqqA